MIHNNGMEKHREAISYRSTYTVAAVTRSLMFMLIFWFAGCAAGSCLSYGHSCWGAHGKRSGYINYPVVNDPDNENSPSLSGPAPSNDRQPLHDQWILSRLVTRQLTVPGAENYRGNWYDSSRGERGEGHGHNWDSNDVAVMSDDAKPLRRDEIEIEDDDEEDETREETVILPRVMSRETRGQLLGHKDMSDRVDADELVLVPPMDNHLKKAIDQSHKLRFFKILNGAAEKLK